MDRFVSEYNYFDKVVRKKYGSQLKAFVKNPAYTTIIDNGASLRDFTNNFPTYMDNIFVRMISGRVGLNREVTASDLEDAKDKVMLGVERRSLVVSDDERKLTAYHEAGHAIVSLRIPVLDPVHKVSIVPRGTALGLTFSLPEEDRHNYTKEYINGRLAMAYGGRVAEELIFGLDKVTTGAAQDIRQATEMARQMVTQFGMSDAVGPVAVGDQEHQIFLGREFSQRREVSNGTAELVDREVKRILEEGYSRAQKILKGDLDTLHRMAEVLLERETIGREEVELIAAGKELPERPPADTESASAPASPPAEKKTSSADPGPVLGSPPTEPAGA